MDAEKQQRFLARLLGPIGALTIVLGILFAQDFVKGLGTGIILIGLILAVWAWRTNRSS